jgi:hypothetical protein
VAEHRSFLRPDLGPLLGRVFPRAALSQPHGEEDRRDPEREKGLDDRAAYPTMGHQAGD